MANTYKALQAVTVGAGGVSSITFNNIPQNYTDLVVKSSSRTNGTNGTYFVNFNGNNNNTISLRLYSQGATVGNNIFSNAYFDYGNQSNTTANVFSSSEMYILNYVGNANKLVSVETALEDNGTANSLFFTAGLKNSTAPITSITIAPVIDTLINQNSTFTLYGVFNQDVSSAPATPTIGTASDNGLGGASVAFTGVSGAASYVATSTPSGITGTGTASPVTVSGLDFGTAYTFKVKALNPLGESAESAASNSVTPLSAFESIATNTLGSNANSITFSSIPSTYKHLQLRGFARKSGGTGIADVTVTFNGDSGANYTRSWTFTFDGAGPYTSRGTNSNGFSMGYFGNNGSDSLFGSYVLDIADYTNTNKFKTAQYLNGVEKTSAGNTVMLHGTGSWLNTAAISSITLSCSDITAGSTFALYGIKG